MRTRVKIIFILTGIFTLTNLFLDVSFKVDLIDKIILVLFYFFGLLLIMFEPFKLWIKLILVITILIVSCSIYFLWEIFGYESRIDYVWTIDEYNIELEHRLEIAGPGCYWFLVNKDILNGLMERRVECRQYQAGLPIPPETFEFKVDSKNITIQCCDPVLLQGFSMDKFMKTE
jgi:hypothetical protein